MSAPSREDLTGVLLAGGGGTRLGGVPKGKLRKGGRTLADATLELLRAVTAVQLVVANTSDYDDLGIPVFSDLRIDHGPLAGLEAALAGTATEHAIVVACDMPCLEGAVLALLAARDRTFDVVLPIVRGEPEPLCARYARRCLAYVEAALDAGKRKMTSFHEGLSVERLDESVLRTADPSLASFENANSADDLARLGVDLP